MYAEQAVVVEPVTASAMDEGTSKVSCEEFQTRLPELISSGIDVANHSHVKACQLCTALRDLDRIARNAQRFKFGVDDSEADDWSKST